MIHNQPESALAGQRYAQHHALKVGAKVSLREPEAFMYGCSALALALFDFVLMMVYSRWVMVLKGI